MRIMELYKKLYIGLYLCFIFTILASYYPVELFESFSLVDFKNLKPSIEKIRKDLKFSGDPQNVPASVEPDQEDGSVVSALIKLSGSLKSQRGIAFKLFTPQALVYLVGVDRKDGQFSVAFLRRFETVPALTHPILFNQYNKYFIILALCAIIAFYLMPLYTYNFSAAAANESHLEKKIIRLPLIIMLLVWAAGFVKTCFNLAGCYMMSGEISGATFTTFFVSLLIYATLTGLMTLGITQEYINKYIAAPFFEKYKPYEIRYGSSINLSMRFFIIIFATGIAPILTCLYLPLSFNAARISNMSSIFDVMDNYNIVVPLLITICFAIYFFIMQMISMFSFRKNVIVPINKLIGRMKLVSKGDFKCKTSVLYVDEIGQLKGHFNSMLDGLLEREKIKDTFGKFMSIEIAEKLLNEKKINLMGEEIEATILFSDIRDFTPLSEKLEASALVEFLNLYFSHIVKPIHEYNGVINKFIGDAVMAVFAPTFGVSGHEDAAVAAALGMQRALATFNELKKYPAISAGIGIHRGKLVAGNVGTEERMEYTFIGDNVNIASRIESETKKFKTDILMSEDIVNKINKQNFSGIDFIKLGPVMMKGKSVPLELYGIMPK